MPNCNGTKTVNVCVHIYPSNRHTIKQNLQALRSQLSQYIVISHYKESFLSHDFPLSLRCCLHFILRVDWAL